MPNPWIPVVGALSCVALAAIAIVTQPLVTPGPPAQAAVDPARLEAHVRHLSETLYPRSHDQFANIDRAARYVEAQLLTTGARVSVQDVVVEATTYRNIIARFGPDQGPVLVIGAHYDSHGDAAEGAKSPPHFRTGHMGSAWHARSLKATGRPACPCSTPIAAISWPSSGASATSARCAGQRA